MTTAGPSRRPSGRGVAPTRLPTREGAHGAPKSSGCTDTNRCKSLTRPLANRHLPHRIYGVRLQIVKDGGDPAVPRHDESCHYEELAINAGVPGFCVAARFIAPWCSAFLVQFAIPGARSAICPDATVAVAWRDESCSYIVGVNR